MLLLALITSTMLGTISAFSTSYTMFAISRALCGVAISGLSIIGVVLGKGQRGQTHTFVLFFHLHFFLKEVHSKCKHCMLALMYMYF